MKEKAKDKEYNNYWTTSKATLSGIFFCSIRYKNTDQHVDWS